MNSPHPNQLGGSAPADPFPLDLAIDEWRIHVNPGTGKVVFTRAFRPELAHLTIMWGTASGDLDVHLTHGHDRAMLDGGGKDYIPIARFSKSELEVASAFAPVFMEKVKDMLLREYRKWRPGWLARNSYMVSLASQEDTATWAKGVAPRKKQKFRVRADALDPTQMPPSFSNLYDPRDLDQLQKVRDAEDDFGPRGRSSSGTRAFPGGRRNHWCSQFDSDVTAPFQRML